MYLVPNESRCGINMHVYNDHCSNPFIPADLFEERALLLSRLGRHEVTLTIYAHVLKEPEMAEEYVEHQTSCISNCIHTYNIV